MSRWTHLTATKMQCAVSISRSLPLRTLGYSLGAILTAPADSRLLQHPSYVPIADLAGRPRVLLLGDSISIGYTLQVRRALRGVANIHRLPTNCGSTRNGVTRLDAWLSDAGGGEGRWDVIHLNFGLHDCVRANGEEAVPLAEYRRNLESIFDRLQQSGTRLAWASTTSVARDLRHHDATADQTIEYRDADVEEYNAAAAAVALQHGAEIDPLGESVRSRLQALQISEDIHFSKRGYRALGEQVASFLWGMLAGNEKT